MKTGHILRIAPVAAAAMVASAGALAQTQSDTAAELRQLREELRQLRPMQEEIQRLRGELDAVKRQQAATASAAVATAGAPTAAPAQSGWGTSPPTTASNGSMTGSGVSLFGYGELSYSRPRRDSSAATATAGRGVLGFAYRFNERTRMAAELEVENAVVSASDRGEVAFEQLYIERDLTDRIAAKAGLFLLPIGFLNETHEPTRYYGVNRNQVETAIIPTTWRELGLGLRGATEAGLRWDTGIVTGFDLNKWDATAADGRESPLGAIHQEGQLARARSLAFYGALNYNGIPGVNVGGTLYHGGAGHKQAGFAGADARISLAEAHARWQVGRWDLSALAARGRFTGVSALNATFAGNPTPVPDSFGGWYAQAAYRVWQQGDLSLVPFVRYERLNTARGYSGLPAGLAPAIAPDIRTWTAGANFYLHPQVVIKVDYQSFGNDHNQDRLNLGVGFHF
ncbi:hypothetical protein [Ramlibacter sp.]|uniref:hypothetical protein n=1 Tax=Ramlibacter sp. TaxID=1917967 RepID=UPI0017C42AE2|nr:hypothetical protein [Ramlibacter sp.]MBA2675727.1 hypothetical protein [Ramlibacter sp.]